MNRTTWTCLVAGLICLGVTEARAQLSADLLRVEAESQFGEGTVVINAADGEWDIQAGRYVWALSQPLDVRDREGATIATLWSASITVFASPKIDLSVSVESGDSQTTFVMDSTYLHLSSKNDQVEARARAAFSITDLNFDGAELRALGPPGSGAFRAEYNGDALFSQMISRIFTSASGSASAFQNDPSIGFRPVGGDVGGMESRLAFTVTPGDIASATTTFELSGAGSADFFFVGDLNCDTEVGLADITGFVTAMTDPVGYELLFPNCDPLLADVDGSGDVSVADINGFVSAVLSRAAE